MKFVKLLTAAYVGGVLRHPHEGVLHVDDDDAARLIEDEAAEDVTADFPAEADDRPVDKIAAPGGMEEAAAAAHPHQAEAPPATDREPTTKPAKKSAASKEA